MPNALHILTHGGWGDASVHSCRAASILELSGVRIHLRLIVIFALARASAAIKSKSRAVEGIGSFLFFIAYLFFEDFVSLAFDRHNSLFLRLPFFIVGQRR